MADPVQHCYYCGDPADTVDHTVPQDVLRALAILDDDDTTRKMRAHMVIMTVPCCRECNNLLGDEYFDTLLKRKDYLKRQLRKRYKRFLKLPRWTDRQLSTLSSEMQEYVKQAVALHHHLLRRLAW